MVFLKTIYSTIYEMIMKTINKIKSPVNNWASFKLDNYLRDFDTPNWFLFSFVEFW